MDKSHDCVIPWTGCLVEDFAPRSALWIINGSTARAGVMLHLGRTSCHDKVVKLLTQGGFWPWAISSTPLFAAWALTMRKQYLNSSYRGGFTKVPKAIINPWQVSRAKRHHHEGKISNRFIAVMKGKPKASLSYPHCSLKGRKHQSQQLLRWLQFPGWLCPILEPVTFCIDPSAAI